MPDIYPDNAENATVMVHRHEEAARLLSVTVDDLHEMISTGQITIAPRRRRRWRGIPQSEITRILEARS